MIASTADPVSSLHGIVDRFAIDGAMIEAAPYGSGHINDTVCATCLIDGQPRRFIFQRLNNHVFKNLPGLMDNVDRACAHMQRKLLGDPDATRKALSLIPSRAGKPAVIDDEGRWWRCYPFIENSCSRDLVQCPPEAEAAARAFGAYIRELADLPGDPLVETIPDFHNTPKRLDQLAAVVAADPQSRGIDCREDIDFVFDRGAFAACVQNGLDQGSLPRRVIHNDTKINNVLLDSKTLRGLCVIDLDTLMPGSPLFDMSDVLRTSISTCVEDEIHCERIEIRMDVLAAVYRGFVEELGDTLCPAERELLPHCAALLAYECGCRFLADHIAGDIYFKVHRPDHNLQRARSQFAIVRRCEERIDDIRGICEELLR